MSVIKRLYKNKLGGKLGGVCQGLSEYFEVDPSIVRIIWVLGVLFYGTGALAYLVMWIILPEKSEVMSKNVKNPEYTIKDEIDDDKTQ